MHVPHAPLRQPYGSIRSADIAAASTVSPSGQANEWSLGFMVIWYGMSGAFGSYRVSAVIAVGQEGRRL